MESKFLSNYEYLLDLPNTDIREVNIDGSRKSGKTVHVAIATAVAAYNTPNTNIIAIRRNRSDVRDSIEKDYKVAFKMIGINPTHMKASNKYEFSNGNTIKLFGAYSPNSNKMSLSGNLSYPNTDLLIVWLEEVFEYTEEEYLSIKEAARGAKRIVFINTCNPWSKDHWHIKKVDNALPYNHAELVSKGEQFIDEGGIITHHTNFRINTFLERDDLQSQWDFLEMFPKRALTSSDGMPGIEGNITYDNLENAILRDEDKLDYYKEYTMSVDYGDGLRRDASGTSAHFGAFSNNIEDVHLFDEYWHRNANMEIEKDLNELADDIIKFGIAQRKEHRVVGEVLILVDNAATSFIQVIRNKIAEQGFTRQFDVRGSTKKKIEERVLLTNALLTTGKLKISLKCKRLWLELENATSTSTHARKSTNPEKKPDVDALDSMEYLISRRFSSLWRYTQPIKDKDDK